MSINIADFQRGIFALGTNFGELAQLMIQKLEGFTPANGKYYDLLDTEGNKIEVKFSRAKKKLKPLKDSNLIDYCLSSTVDSRAMQESEASTVCFDCNIQQLKPNEFDILYYGIFFKDSIVIFKATSEEVVNMPGYSIQHKGGSEYQFHINKSNFKTHMREKTGYFHMRRPHREFCVSDFRQNQEYHVINVQDGGLFPLVTPVPEGWDGMRAVCGVNAGAACRESYFRGISLPCGQRT